VKYIIIFILIAIACYISWGIYYSHTDNGQFSNLLMNSVDQIEHIAKQRDIGATKEETISWFDSDDWKIELKVLRECIIEGIDFVFAYQDIKPKNCANAYNDIVLAKKIMWTNKIIESEQ